jgi:hypothetical protein
MRLRLHASASDIDVIRAARKRIAKAVRIGRAMREDRHEFYREMLACHWDWQTTVNWMR